MDKQNAHEFLDSYNKIDAQLRQLYNFKPSQSFSDMVRRSAEQNSVVRKYENDLMDFARLRNAIVHRATDSEEVFIANPCDNVVENIEFIEKQLCHPPRLTDAIKIKKIASVFADKPLIVPAQKSDDWQMASWFGADAQRMDIVATYNLVFNASLMVDEGLGYAICFDKIINLSGDSRLCFRPLSPEMKAEASVIWKRYKVFSKAAQKFIDEVQQCCEIKLSGG